MTIIIVAQGGKGIVQNTRGVSYKTLEVYLVTTLEVYLVTTLEVYLVTTLEVYHVTTLEVYRVTTLEVYCVIALEVYLVKTRGIKCSLEITKQTELM